MIVKTQHQLSFPLLGNTRTTRLIWFLILFFSFQSWASHSVPKPEDFGFRHYTSVHKGDTSDYLVYSFKGEEQIRKPLFFMCQGSLPVPLIITHEGKPYGTFPFNPDSLSKYYHLVIVSKPGIPLIAEDSTLAPGYICRDLKTGKMPAKYSQNNYLEYYSDRNLRIISELRKMPFIDKSKIVVAGHSQGATIAAHMASESSMITHLIYASGNPMGQIMSMIGAARKSETDSSATTSSMMKYWNDACENRNDLDDEHGDTYKSVYDFSYPAINYLRKVKIPVLVCWGTADYCTPYLDYMQVEFIRDQRRNFTFKPYVKRDHNYFGLTKEGRTDYNNFGWDIVAKDWLTWLRTK